MKILVQVFSFLVTFIVIGSGEFLAQPNYNFSAVLQAYAPLPGGTPFTWRISPNPNDDDYSAPTSIVGPPGAGFGGPFIYDGFPFTEIQVSCNGFLKFCNSGTGDTLNPLNNLGKVNNLRGNIRNVLAPLWDDLAVINAANDIVYQFVGPPGFQVLTIEWRNVNWDWTSPINANFQIRLYENNNQIEFHYGFFPNPPGASASASVGMNDGTPISSPANGVEATGTFLSINFGGTPGGVPWGRRFHRSYGYEFDAINQAPDITGPLPAQTTLFQFIPQFPAPLAVLPAVYTVNGPVGPLNFRTLSDAAEALNLNFLAGPIQINIRPSNDPGGVWDDIFHLIPITGSHPLNTILVQNDPQYGPITISPTNGISDPTDPSAVTSDAIIRLDGTRYTTIQGAGVMNGINIIDNAANITPKTKFDIGIFLGNAIVTTFNIPSIVTGAQSNTLFNLHVDMNNSLINNRSATGIMLGTNGPNADPSQCNSFNTIQACDIEDFHRAGILMSGFSPEVPDINNSIQMENIIHDAVINVNSGKDCAGIDVYNQKNLLITYTDVYKITGNILQNNGVWGIRANSTTTNGTSGAFIIRNVNIYDIENRNAQVNQGVAVGIEVTSPYHEGLLDINSNKVYDIFSNGVQGNAAGMKLSLGSNGNSALLVHNNYIYDIRAPRSPLNPSVRGLDIQSLKNILDAKVYFNTVVLDNAVMLTTPNHYSACLYWTNMLSSSLDLRNNILVNGMGSNAGVAACIYASSNANLLRLAYTSDNNLYRTFTPPLPPFTPIAYDGMTPFTSLTMYQAAVSTGGLGGPREVQSVTELPPFVQPINPIVGGIAQDFHLTAGSASQAESGALPILGYNFDWDNQARNPITPDIGADEWQGALVADLIPPQILYTLIPDDNLLGPPPTLVATIRDRSGVPPGNPQLWYKRTIDPAFVAMVSIPGPGSNEFSFTINYGFLPPVPPLAVGDIIEYFVGAVDGAPAANYGTNPSGGGLPPNINPPPIRNTYTIVAAPIPSGTYSVGLNPFNKLIGKQLYPQTFTKVVKEKVRVERNIEPNLYSVEGRAELIDLSLFDPNLDQDYSFDANRYSPTEFKIMDVVKEYVQLMDNGEVYQGPNFISATKEDLERAGVNTEGMENVLGVWSTLTAAVNELNLRGISGAVTLSLVDNNYPAETYPIELKSISGVSAANTITIKPGPGMTPNFTTPGGATSLDIVKIINTNFVTIDGSNTIGGKTRDLTFDNINTGIGQGIWIGSLGTTPISDITIKNCNILTGETSGSTPIMVSDGTNAGSSGYFTNIKIQNDSLMRGRQGIFINGGIIPQYGTNILIEDCKLNTSGAKQFKLYGIYVQGCSGVFIRNNDIGNFESVSYETDRGIWLARGTVNVLVEKNKIHDLNSTLTSGGTGNGGNGIAISSSSLLCNNIIRNNFIYSILGRGSNILSQNPVGIHVFGAQTGIGIYHNSIYLSGTALDQTSSFSAGISIGYGSAASSSGSFNIDIRNNILSNSLCPTVAGVAQSNGAMGIFAFTSLSQFNSLNNNVYYLTPVRGSRSYGHINGLPSIGFNLAFNKWQINSGLDVSSLNGDPQFINPGSGDLHISTILGTPCESGGFATLAADDIDGELRSPTPDIGADEFSGTKYSLTLTALIEGFYDNGTNLMVPDTVKLFLRNISSPWAIVDSSIGELSSSGVCTFKFNNPIIGTSYYLQVAHRNTIDTWSRNGGENFNLYAFSYNFTTDSAKAYGDNMKKKGTKWCMFSGDVPMQDGLVDLTDEILVINDVNAFASGVSLPTDLNGDQSADLTDIIIVVNNTNTFVSKQTPGPKIMALRKIKEKIILK